MNAKSNHNPENLLSLGGSRLNGRAQDCDLTPIFGDLTQSERRSEIKPLLVCIFMTLVLFILSFFKHDFVKFSLWNFVTYSNFD